MVKLKVCGMRDPGNIEAVAALQPHYMGFIFYSKSPRYVGEDFSFASKFPDTIKRVGVFVNENTKIMLTLSERLGLKYLQLHGQEPVEQLAELKDQGAGLIKVFSVDDQFDFRGIIPYKPYVDYFLFDTKGQYYGGNARTFDWRVLEQYDQEIPFFLSGGLTAENIEGVKNLKDMNLHALDINSGVEVSPGLKSSVKVIEVTKILNSIS